MAAQGTKIADVFVGMGLEMSAYRSDLAKAKSEAIGIGTQIRAALSGNWTGGTSQVARLITDLQLGRSNLKSFGDIARATGFAIRKDLGTGLSSAFKSATSEISSIGSHVFGHLKSLAGDVFKGFALGAGFLGFLSLERVVEKLTSAIPELINKGKEFAESIHTLTIETGATSEKASALLTIYQFLGGTATDLNQKVNRLSTTIHTNEAALNALGVVTRDSNGNILDQIALIDNLRHVFSTLPEGPRKTELALRSFGRNGATALGPLLHYLNLTDEQITQLTEDAAKQGNILSESQLLAADAVGKAQARISNAYTGLANRLFAEVGPKLASFFDGIADFITANAQRIADAISGIVAQIVGLVQGLLGINLGSFSAQFSNIVEGGSQWAGALVDDTAELKRLEGQLNPTRTATQKHNDAIDASIKALDAEGKSIDRQIEKLNRLGEVQDRIFRRHLENLTRQYDAELALLDAEDQRLARADQADQDTRNAERADRDAAKAKRDLAGAQVDLANAQARYNEDLAHPDADPHKQQQTLAQDLLGVADAAQKVRDAQQGITDAQQGQADAQAAFGTHARENAEADRRAEIARVKEYVASIEKIVEDSENKKAALKTLKNRQGVLEDQIAQAEARGDTSAADFLKTKLAAVLEGETALNQKIKNQAGVDALTARKAELANEVEALRNAKQSETAINAEELNKQIAALKRKIEEDKRQLAAEALAHKKLQDEIDQGLITTAKTSDTVLGPAFERARLAGIKMAEDVKKAIGSIMDILVGKEGPPEQRGGQGKTPGARTGGLFGAVSGIAGAFQSIAPAVGEFWSALTKFDPKAVGFAIAVFGATKLSVPLVLAGLAIAGIAVGVDIATAAAEGPLGNPGSNLGDSAGDVKPLSAERVAYGTIAHLEHLSPVELKKPYEHNKDTGLVETGEQALYRLIRETGDGKYSHGGYETGGKIPGASGQAVPITAHGGEYVLTERETKLVERERLARAPGQTIRQFVATMLRDRSTTASSVLRDRQTTLASTLRDTRTTTTSLKNLQVPAMFREGGLVTRTSEPHTTRESEPKLRERQSSTAPQSPRREYEQGGLVLPARETRVERERVTSPGQVIRQFITRLLGRRNEPARAGPTESARGGHTLNQWIANAGNRSSLSTISRNTIRQGERNVTNVAGATGPVSEQQTLNQRIASYYSPAPVTPQVQAIINLHAAPAGPDKTKPAPSAERSPGVVLQGEFAQGGIIPGPRGAPAPVLAHGGEAVLSLRMLDALRDLANGQRFTGSGAAGGGFEGEVHVHVNVPWDNGSIDFISRELAYRRRT